MNNEHCHHVIEASYKLLHYHLDNKRIELVLLVLHDLLEVTTVAKLHEDVVSSISFNGLPHFHYVLRLDSILVLNFADNQALLHLAELLALNHFASVEF